jgi:hypothetical protein
MRVSTEPFKDSESPEDIMADPTKFGAPTFEEFAKNPDMFRPHLTLKDLLGIIDDGSKLEGFKRNLSKDKFEIDGYGMESLTKIEDYCRNEGLSYESVSWKPEVRQGTSGKLEVVHRLSRK